MTLKREIARHNPFSETNTVTTASTKFGIPVAYFPSLNRDKCQLMRSPSCLCICVSACLHKSISELTDRFA